MELNTKDRKILAELDLNARASFQEIGRRAGLSKESVIYRVKNLEKNGIIQRYTTLVNFSKLGYTGYGVYSRFQNVNEALKKEIIKYLSDMPEVYWIALVGGKFDIAFGIMSKTVFNFNKLYYQILAKYGDSLADNTIEIRTELRQHKRNYLTGEKSELTKPPFFGKEPEIEELDGTDSKILSLLSNNARMTILNISELLKIPPSTVSLRIKQMQKREIIQGYGTYIRPQAYEMQSYRLLLYLQNMDEKKRAGLFAYANSSPNMVMSIETVGEWNFEITIEVKNHEELQKEIAKIRNHYHV